MHLFWAPLLYIGLLLYQPGSMNRVNNIDMLKVTRGAITRPSQVSVTSPETWLC